MIKMQINGKEIVMELDTGALCSIINHIGFRIINTNRRLASFTGHVVNCKGRAVVSVKYKNTTHKLNLYVVDGNIYTLCERDGFDNS